ncbi:MAG: hypothetical protein KIT10_02280 [Flavobacteriales bacterium]|nr:hypothetical protein [Flavobacteriales bacterium]
MNTLRPLLFLFLAALLLGACRRDRLFTDDPGVRLEFSLDTMLFDTIFTTVPFSVTKRFVARNLENRAVRVNIVLEGGGPSPFRINVDGVSGTSFEGVEILGGDSVYVFVEASLDQTGQNSPLIHEDHIVFLTNGNEQKVLLVAWGQDAHFFFPDRFIQGFPPFSIIAGGTDQNGNTICETVTWPNDKPYVIYGYAAVDSCSTLQIQPGVRVHVHGGGGLWIYRWGRILAQGSLEQLITFQSDRLEPFYSELPGQWDRIWINDGPAGQDNVFEHVLIKNALIGIQCENWPLVPDAPTSAAKVVLNNVRIRNCSAAGILSRNFRITSNNLLVGDCGQYAVALTGGGEYFFNHSTIANYWNYGIRQTPAFVMTNTYADITGNVQVREILNSQFLNGIIYGGNPNEFLLEFNDAVAPQFTFDRFILRTDQATSNLDWFPFQDRIWRNIEPGFVSSVERNFRLTQGAFARNRGTSSTIEAIQDINGDMRNCDGEGFDLGCYEWCPD